MLFVAIRLYAGLLGSPRASSGLPGPPRSLSGLFGPIREMMFLFCSVWLDSTRSFSDTCGPVRPYFYRARSISALFGRIRSFSSSFGAAHIASLSLCTRPSSVSFGCVRSSLASFGAAHIASLVFRTWPFSVLSGFIRLELLTSLHSCVLHLAFLGINRFNSPLLDFFRSCSLCFTLSLLRFALGLSRYYSF